MIGNVQKAKAVLQISIYQHLLSFVGTFPSYMMLSTDNEDRFEENLKRIILIIEVFEINKLHPNVSLQIYFAAAQGYTMFGKDEKALDMLDKYCNICTTNFFPYSLHGDEFFDSINEWFNEFDLGTRSPRDEKLIKESMIQSITVNPVFVSLAEDARYKVILETMKSK